MSDKACIEETPSAPTPVDLFGPNSDGGMRLMEWLDVMCLGCKHESAKDRNDGIGGGAGCELVSRAIAGPHEARMAEWSPDAVQPERFGELDQPNPWPVCMAYEKRAQRSDKGLRRGPRVSGMDALFEMTGSGS